MRGAQSDEMELRENGTDTEADNCWAWKETAVRTFYIPLFKLYTVIDSVLEPALRAPGFEKIV